MIGEHRQRRQSRIVRPEEGCDRAHSRNIWVFAKIKLGIEARTRLTALLPAICGEMHRGIYPACRDIGIVRKIVTSVEQIALPDFPHDPPLLAPRGFERGGAYD